ncbi:MAG: ABC transporter substrate-binding protein [Actinomycetota bacterium]|nr:ABC transporter substrate-binding protein [Actinomycetota bacterium]
MNVRSHVAGLVPMFAAAAVLAACGSSSAISSSASGVSTTVAGTPTTSLGSVTIAKAVNTEDLTAVDVAQKEGYFTKAGVDVKSILVGGSSVVNASLQSGSVQFGLASAAAVLLAESHNIPLIVVGAITQGDNAQLVVSDAWIKSHNLSPAEPIASRIKGLEGTKFARLSTSDGAALSDFEQESGVPASSISNVAINSESAMLAAMQHGLVQEFIASPPTSTIAVSDGLGTVLASAKDLKFGAGQEYNVLITTPAYAKAHSAIVTAVTTALGKALSDMSAQTPAALAAVQSVFPTLTPGVVKSSLEFFSFAKGMEQSQTGWNDALSFAEATGILKPGVVVSVSEGGIWTNQYLK